LTNLLDDIAQSADTGHRIKGRDWPIGGT